MKRVLFLFAMVFVAACSGKVDGYGYGYDPSADGGTSEPWGDGVPSPPDAGDPWADASPDPGADGGTDPSDDAGVDPTDAAADSTCPPPPPPPPPPCGCPLDASVPEPDAG
jgi:hypothetical protein